MVKFMLGDAIELLLLALVINGVLILLLTIDDDWGFVANGVVFDAAATTDAIEDEMLAGVVGTEMDFVDCCWADDLVDELDIIGVWILLTTTVDDVGCWLLRAEFEAIFTLLLLFEVLTPAVFKKSSFISSAIRLSVKLRSSFSNSLKSRFRSWFCSVWARIDVVRASLSILFVDEVDEDAAIDAVAAVDCFWLDSLWFF